MGGGEQGGGTVPAMMNLHWNPKNKVMSSMESVSTFCAVSVYAEKVSAFEILNKPR